MLRKVTLEEILKDPKLMRSLAAGAVELDFHSSQHDISPWDMSSRNPATDYIPETVTLYNDPFTLMAILIGRFILIYTDTSGEGWGYDIHALPSNAMAKGMFAKLNEVATFMVSPGERWLTEDELWIFLMGIGDQIGTWECSDAEWAAAMFDAFMAFNRRASDESAVSLRLLVNESARMIAASSVIALCSDPDALDFWAPNGQESYGVLLHRWAQSFTD